MRVRINCPPTGTAPSMAPCSAMNVGGSGPEIRCLIRNMKPVLSAYADPAKNKLGIKPRAVTKL